MSDSDFVTDFMEGQKDCQDGVDHQMGRSEAYARGYAAEYQLEQNKTALSLMGDKHGE